MNMKKLSTLYAQIPFDKAIHSEFTKAVILNNCRLLLNKPDFGYCNQTGI